MLGRHAIFRSLFPLALFLALTASAPAQNYFRVERRNGIWWFIAPNGAPTLSIGVDTIRFAGDQIDGSGLYPYLRNVEKLYPSRAAWGDTALRRLRNWGFNTIGAWSDSDLWNRGTPYTVILDIAAHAGADWQHGVPPDVYSPRFELAAREIAQRQCLPRAGDAALVGYFSDNELRWGPDWRGPQTMLAMYLSLPADAPGRRQAVEFLRRRYANDIRSLNREWKTAATDFERVDAVANTPGYLLDSDDFLFDIANRYFQVCAAAIHRADPHHLYLGARFAGRPPDPVLRAAAVADVVSINVYAFNPRPLVEHVYTIAPKPILVTEFAFRSEDSGLPNSRGAGPKVPDQAARAKAYRNYVIWLEGLPEAVGYHWFEYEDEPKEGRFDGENSNYGLVDIADKPYPEFVEAVRSANRAALETHEKLGSR